MTSNVIPRCEAMLHRLQNWWWSPKPPEHYTFMLGDERIGLGTVGYQLPAEFNLVWASSNRLLMNPRMQHYVTASVNLMSLNMSHKVQGEQVRDWITLCKPEFCLPVFQHDNELPKLAKAQIVSSIKLAIKLRSA